MRMHVCQIKKTMLCYREMCMEN